MRQTAGKREKGTKGERVGGRDKGRRRAGQQEKSKEARSNAVRGRRRVEGGADRTGAERPRRAEVQRDLETLERDQNRTKGGLQGQRHT